ncbi:MAG TPA: hypothetical protein VFO65_02550, partial [Acidimicrobiales bacterium]|nr:hypothetical protein [Acidimicrobiales bacterium]
MSGRLSRRARTVAAAVALLVVGGSGTATAQVNLSPKMSGSIATPVEGEVLDKAVPTVAGQFEYGSDAIGPLGRVREVEITLIPGGEQQLPEGSSTVVRAADPARTLPFSWQSPPLPWNGPYTVRVVAKGETRLGAAQTSPPLDRHFALAAPPLRPINVKVAAAGTDGVTVTWAKNPEPDLVLYEVRRAGAGQPFAPVAQTTAALTTLTDKPGVGDWRYVVVAIRRGADSETGVASAPSTEAGLSIVPPTTAAPAGGSGAAAGGTGAGAGTGTGAGTGASGSATTPGAAGGESATGASGSTRVDLSG